jgi:hypothetical protein
MLGTADVIAAISVRVAQNHVSTKRGFIFAYIWVVIITIGYFFLSSMEHLIPIIIL